MTVFKELPNNEIVVRSDVIYDLAYKRKYITVLRSMAGL